MPRRLPKSLPGDEPERLLAAARSPRNRAVILLGFFAGLRISEIVERRVEDIDLAGSMIQVRGKGDKDRAVPLPSRIIPEIRGWIGARTDGWLFPSPTSASGHITPRCVQWWIKTCARRAGITHKVTPHRLRHSYATRLLRRGADIMQVRDLMGHASIATTELYLSADPDHLRDPVERL